MPISFSRLSLLVVFLSCQSAFSQSSTDSLSYFAPDETILHGPFRTTLDASRKGRLTQFIPGPDCHAIAIYNADSVRLSKSEGWDGECAGKWLYTAARSVERTHDPVLQQHLERVADYLVSQQDSSGYLGTYNAAARFTSLSPARQPSFDLWMNGYIMQGMMETYRLTGNERYLAATRRIADLCIRTFHEGGMDVAFSGPWDGMASACVLEHFADLYLLTREEKYLHFAEYCLAALDRRPAANLLSKAAGAEDVSAIGEGKMYEMLHCLVGVARLYEASRSEVLLAAMTGAWQKIRNHLNAAGGPSGGVHVFRECYDSAGVFSPYAFSETCAMMDWLRFNKELLLITGSAKYADEIEKTSYNALLGASYPDGEGWVYHSFMNGQKIRTDPYACCSSSGAMTLEEVPGVIYMRSARGVQVNLLMPSSLHFALGSDSVRIEQITDYPFRGAVTIHVDPVSTARFLLRVRVPSWAEGATLRVGGGQSRKVTPGEFVVLDRSWKKGDAVHLSLPMRLRPVVRTYTDSTQTLKAAAFYRGPLLYSAAWKDERKASHPLVIPAGSLDSLDRVVMQTGPGGAPSFLLSTLNGEILFSPYMELSRMNTDVEHLVWVRL